MTTKVFAALVWSTWLVLAVALVVAILSTTRARAADMADCHAYANRGSAAALKQLLAFPWIDVSAGRFLYRKAYSFCLNADDVPPLVFTPEEQPIVDGLPVPIPRLAPPPGSVPAVDATDPVPAPDGLVAPTKPALTGKPLCVKYGKRTVYHGKHWRCQK